MKSNLILACLVATLCVVEAAQAEDFPDLRSVAADLRIPELTEGQPAAGKRVKAKLLEWQKSAVYHVLHLPENWKPHSAQVPVLVEWAGNGGYTNEFGDTCDGRPEGCRLGYGLTAGRDFIWLCLPYLNSAGDGLALQWWGDAPAYDPEPTLSYCRAAVDEVCRNYAGDRRRVVLCGFSRGAIACNYLGLHDDATAQLWCGFFAYSHYDGVRRWPPPDSDPTSARERLQRLGLRPQFVCSEALGADAVKQYLSPLISLEQIAFHSSGFRNHSDAWILRPSLARTAARQWLRQVTQVEATHSNH